jgi:glycosyltransferase involved in cell wall biosynthesis
LNSWIAAGLELAAETWSYRRRRTRCVGCVSQGLAREVAELYPGVAPIVQSIANGVDLEAFAPSPSERAEHRARLGLGDEDLLALFVGGDWRRKGLREAIRGIAAAPGWQLAVLGAGNDKEFTRLARHMQAAERVHFLGRGRPHGWYAAADALVLPSRYEAFSLVMLEAAASGLPLIVPRINGSDELVQDGVTGWFTEPDGAAIAERLQRLAADPDLHASMRQASRLAAREYDWERVVEKRPFSSCGSGSFRSWMIDPPSHVEASSASTCSAPRVRKNSSA